MTPKFSENTLKFIIKASKQKKEDWLDKNRDEYERDLQLPLQNLAQYLQSKLQSSAADYHFPQRGIGRIKRSANRIKEYGTIYKDWINYSASRPAESRFESNPNLYFEIDPTDSDGDHVLVAGGLYHPSSAQLRAIRNAIAEDATAFQKLFASKSFSSRFKGGFCKDRISSRVTRGFDPEHPRMEWLRLQAFFVWRAYSKKEFTSPKFPEVVAQDWKQILRLNELLDQTIQASNFKIKPKKLISELNALDMVVRKMDF